MERGWFYPIDLKISNPRRQIAASGPRSSCKHESKLRYRTVESSNYADPSVARFARWIIRLAFESPRRHWFWTGVFGRTSGRPGMAGKSHRNARRRIPAISVRPRDSKTQSDRGESRSSDVSNRRWWDDRVCRYFLLAEPGRDSEICRERDRETASFAPRPRVPDKLTGKGAALSGPGGFQGLVHREKTNHRFHRSHR